MSYFQCPHCGTRSDIFGHGGARHEAERLGVPFLGEIPLHMSIRATSDSGNPVVDSEPDGPHAAIYRAIGDQGPRPAPGRHRRSLRPVPVRIRLSFNQCSHAFVAFSRRPTSVLKGPRQSAPDDVEFARRRRCSQEYGKRPIKEMPE